MKQTPERLAYSMTEAAAATGLSVSHLERAIKDGELRSKVTRLRADGKTAGKRIILSRDLQAYLDGLVDA